MSPDLLSAIRIGPRLLLVTLLPNLAFTTLITFLLVAGAPAQRPSLQAVDAALSDLSFSGAALLIAGTIIGSIAMYPLNYPLIQLVEGYWLSLPLMTIVREVAIKSEIRRRAYLESLLYRGVPGGVRPEIAEAAREQIRWVPQNRNMVLPTMFGNTMRVGEAIAGSRYGTNTRAVWPRLVRLLPEGDRSQVADARDQMDTSVRMCVLALVAVPVTMLLLLPYDTWLLVPIGCYLFSWMAYRAAIAGAKRFCQTLSAMFDLHHLRLWDALALERPANLPDEQGKATALSRLFADGKLPPYMSESIAYLRPEPSITVSIKSEP